MRCGELHELLYMLKGCPSTAAHTLLSVEAGLNVSLLVVVSLLGLWASASQLPAACKVWWLC